MTKTAVRLGAVRLGSAYTSEPVFSFRVHMQDYTDQIKYVSQPAIICLKLTIETLEQGVKYV